ncbi:hypothetical protein [Solicola sp. PLA-1-18]|uniref:hypothetical protein n=1 Tax=Solicola sp. PLA-1-18 TaxID=3380532 RepID=UPI003B7E5D0B
MGATARTGHQKATLRLRVTSAVKGADRRGRIIVRWTKPDGEAGRKVVRVDRAGRATTHLPRVKAGRRTFTLRWLGNDDLVADRGRAVGRVR